MRVVRRELGGAELITRARYLAASLVLAVLLVLIAGGAFAYSTMGSMMRHAGEGRMMGSMVDHGGEGHNHGGQRHTMGSFDEEQPFDLQFIDQMIMHHQGAIMSSKHMIADSEQPKLRQLTESIQESQSEQIEQMQSWREEWYGDAERTFGMMDPAQMEEMMSEGHMEEMMSGDTTDVMFLRMMSPHHQLAIDMSEQAFDEAEHPELKELAQTVVEEQSAEIELMQGYLEEIEVSESK
jgi:uncharacterized protein (DUF305 family)